ncbi:hypothetical protein WR25_08555 [Diploscapter pachys]|uniref:Carboxylesterase type B domain-containing protein n=1 Tax=Diploscapter pachys TaxID=2018661 RepID=A0A2A2LK68_9BILA|nr:hypothetical protein WR25_08555 [Diploscapter pachys]
MMIAHLSILLISIEAICCQTSRFPEFALVDISKGPIIGKLLKSYDNESAYTFLGIPLAKPTVGKLRFIRPQPVDSWKEPIYTTEFKNACMADARLTYKKLAGGPVSEDCLYMNVYTSHHCLHLASLSYKLFLL